VGDERWRVIRDGSGRVCSGAAAMAAPQWETVRIDGPDSAGIATLTLNRPSRFNALNPSLFQEIPAAVRVLDLDPATRVIIVNAAGRHFCSGIDLTHFSAIIGMAQYSLCPQRIEALSPLLVYLEFHV
jgi:enoyl-CoA hydratase/carnithine racemase